TSQYTVPPNFTAGIVTFLWRCWLSPRAARDLGYNKEQTFFITSLKSTMGKGVIHAPPTDGNGHVALHRYRGVHTPAPAIMRTLRQCAGGVPRPAARCLSAVAWARG